MVTDEDIEIIHDIVHEIVGDAASTEELIFFSDKKVLKDLLIALHAKVDHSPLINSALMAVAQHMFILAKITNNLYEATELLERHSIPFNSMVEKVVDS